MTLKVNSHYEIFNRSPYIIRDATTNETVPITKRADGERICVLTHGRVKTTLKTWLLKDIVARQWLRAKSTDIIAYKDGNPDNLQVYNLMIATPSLNGTNVIVEHKNRTTREFLDQLPMTAIPFNAYNGRRIRPRDTYFFDTAVDRIIRRTASGSDHPYCYMRIPSIELKFTSGPDVNVTLKSLVAYAKDKLAALELDAPISSILLATSSAEPNQITKTLDASEIHDAREWAHTVDELQAKTTNGYDSTTIVRYRPLDILDDVGERFDTVYADMSTRQLYEYRNEWFEPLPVNTTNDGNMVTIHDVNNMTHIVLVDDVLNSIETNSSCHDEILTFKTSQDHNIEYVDVLPSSAVPVLFHQHVRIRLRLYFDYEHNRLLQLNNITTVHKYRLIRSKSVKLYPIDGKEGIQMLVAVIIMDMLHQLAATNTEQLTQTDSGEQLMNT